MPRTVLLAEDDRAIRHALERALTLEGYRVTAVADGVEAVRQLFNAEHPDEVALGSSSTMLAENLGRAIEADFKDDEEIIVTGEHEGTPDASRLNLS